MIKKFFSIKLNKNYLKELKDYENNITKLNLTEADLFKNTNKDYLVTTKNINKDLNNLFDYNLELKKNPFGIINIHNYKGTILYLCGANYTHIPNKNIFKMLWYTNPDLILAQVRPDNILNDFNLNLKNPKTNCFSQRNYIKQLIKNGSDWIPSNKILNDLLKEIKIEKILNIDNEKIQNIKNNNNKNNFNLYENINEKMLGTISIYSELYNKKILMCDLPDIIFKDKLINQFHRFHLEEIIKKSLDYITFNKDLTFLTPLNGAFYTNPENFIYPSDNYICSIIQYLNHKGYKKLFLFLNNLQSNSVIHLLNNKKNERIEKSLKIPELLKIDFKDITNEEIIEKLSILDVMTYGKYLFEDFENKSFNTTYSIIEKYLELEDFNKNSKLNHFRYLHSEFLLKYYKFINKIKDNSEKKLKGEFIKNIIQEYHN